MLLEVSDLFAFLKFCVAGKCMRARSSELPNSQASSSKTDSHDKEAKVLCSVHSFANS